MRPQAQYNDLLNHQMGNGPWESLAYGIISQSAYDYLYLVRREKEAHITKKWGIEFSKEEITRFLRSKWAEFLYGDSCEPVLRRLENGIRI